MFTDASNLLNERASAIDARMVAGVRLLMAFAAVVIIFFDPTEPDRYVSATYASLIAYSLFSLIIFLFVVYEKVLIVPALNNPYWLDVAWYLLFISLSSGTSSIFFFFFYFAILNAAFLRGFRSGLKVTIVSAVGFSVFGYLSAKSSGTFELARFVLRPLSLLSLGYMMSYWGGYQTRNLRRLKLLRDISVLSNPRFGVDRTIGLNMELLRRFFDAETCLLITGDAESGQVEFRKTARGIEGIASPSEPLDRRLAEPMIAVPNHHAAVFHVWTYPFFSKRTRLWVYDCVQKRYIQADERPFQALAERLDAVSYIMAPISYRGETIGRLFIFSDRAHLFEQSDIEFLLQAIAQFIPIVENVRLVDRLASDAADEERKKIARDIHDSIIQPYIGLQMGIDSLAQLLADGDFTGGKEGVPVDQLRSRIVRLRNLTEEGVEDLRNYVHGLVDSQDTEANLLPAVRRFAQKFTVATGIKVNVDCSDQIQIADRLAAEMFQIVAEGLSNVRRHTQSPDASVNIAITSDSAVLTISNQTDTDGAAPFAPRSISERAASLGGVVRIDQSDQRTEVLVEIPL